jgi:uncharacterized protein YdbL (DUF1318 family)
VLNPNAQKLVDALRSGEYEQTTSWLRYGDAMCCLGVACDLSATDVGGQWDGYVFAVSGERKDALLPEAVREWLGFSDQAGAYGDDSLSDKNDTGATFAEIADIIESEPEGLFA